MTDGEQPDTDTDRDLPRTHQADHRPRHRAAEPHRARPGDRTARGGRNRMISTIPGRMRTAPEGGGTPLRGLTHPSRPNRLEGFMKPTRTCTVPGCDRKHYGHDLCRLHLARWKRDGDVGGLTAQRANYELSRTGICSVDDCTQVHVAKGYCRRHYGMIRKRGTTEPAPDRSLPLCVWDPCDRKVPDRRTNVCSEHRVLVKFWSQVEITGSCWNWTGYKVSGYGRIKIDGAHTKAHRHAYTLLVGPIPAGAEMDHLCRNRACVNPDHLQPVSHAENTRRGNTHTQHSTHVVHPLPHEGATPDSNLMEAS